MGWTTRKITAIYAISVFWTRRVRACLDTYKGFGFGGGRSRALHCELKPLRPWEPSQKGLFSARPQRHSEMVVRPLIPYALPSES